jgi:hypothetical protein
MVSRRSQTLCRNGEGSRPGWQASSAENGAASDALPTTYHVRRMVLSGSGCSSNLPSCTWTARSAASQRGGRTGSIPCGAA